MTDAKKATMKSLLRRGDLLVAPGVFDGITVRIAEKVGFPALYMTGYGTVASHLGLPDAGLASYRDMVERVRVLSGLASVQPRRHGCDTERNHVRQADLKPIRLKAEEDTIALIDER